MKLPMLLAGAVLMAGCGGGSSDLSACSTVVDYFDDPGDPEVFLTETLSDLNLDGLADSIRDDIVAAVDRGDEQGAIDRTFDLVDECLARYPDL